MIDFRESFATTPFGVGPSRAALSLGGGSGTAELIETRGRRGSVLRGGRGFAAELHRAFACRPGFFSGGALLVFGFPQSGP